jgi:hypothetical protein
MHIDAILISILKYYFIVELFEKWHSALPPPAVVRFSWATHLGIWRLNLAFLHVLKRQIQRPHRGGGGGLGSPLAGFPPITKNYFFASFSLLT